MKTKYVLIDYENVQPQTMAGLDQEHVKIIVFVGASQSKVSFEIASLLQSMGSRAQYIKISGNGANALDFHLAYYLGQLVQAELDADFHVISNDTGFDPLIEHLKSKGVCASRVSYVASSRDKTTQSPPMLEKLAAVVMNLRQRGACKPRKVKTLSSTISAIFQKKISDQELTSLINELVTRGIIAVNNTEVTYKLPV